MARWTFVSSSLPSERARKFWYWIHALPNNTEERGGPFRDLTSCIVDAYAHGFFEESAASHARIFGYGTGEASGADMQEVVNHKVRVEVVTRDRDPGAGRCYCCGEKRSALNKVFFPAAHRALYLCFTCIDVLYHTAMSGDARLDAEC